MKSTYFSSGHNNDQLLYFSVSKVFYVSIMRIPLLKERHKLQSLSFFLWVLIILPTSSPFKEGLSIFEIATFECLQKGGDFVWMTTISKKSLQRTLSALQQLEFPPWHLPPHQCNSLYSCLIYLLLVLSSILMHGYSLYHFNCFVASGNHFYFSSTEELAIPISLAYLNLKAD